MIKLKDSREVREFFYGIVTELLEKSEDVIKDKRTILAIDMMKAITKGDVKKTEKLLLESEELIDHDKLYKKMKEQ